MKNVRHSINKNIKMIIIVAAVTAIALGGLLLLISGNDKGRDKVPPAPTEPHEATQEAETKETEAIIPSVEKPVQPQISKEAQRLFDAKVEKIDDSVSVAKLLETIDLKKNVASYSVELLTKNTPKSMNIRFDKTVGEAGKDKFDLKVRKYAEQILALIGDIEEVQWTYNLKKQGKPKESVTVYLNEQQAEEHLLVNVKRFGESAEMLDKLLKQQKGY